MAIVGWRSGSEMDGALSPEEVERYRTDGFFLLRRPVFRPERFAALSGVMEEHLAGAFGDFDRSDQLDVPHFRDPRLLDFLLSDEALALAMAALGTDNVGVWSTHIIAKEAGELPRVTDHCFTTARPTALPLNDCLRAQATAGRPRTTKIRSIGGSTARGG